MTRPDLQKVGEYDGVTLMARRDAKAPYQQPVRTRSSGDLANVREPEANPGLKLKAP